MCRVIIIPGGACRPSFESQSKKVTRLMYSDSVDGRLSNKVLGVHLCRPFEISAGLLDRLLFPFPLEAALGLENMLFEASQPLRDVAVTINLDEKKKKNTLRVSRVCSLSRRNDAGKTIADDLKYLFNTFGGRDATRRRGRVIEIGNLVCQERRT